MLPKQWSHLQSLPKTTVRKIEKKKLVKISNNVSKKRRRLSEETASKLCGEWNPAYLPQTRENIRESVEHCFANVIEKMLTETPQTLSTQTPPQTPPQGTRRHRNPLQHPLYRSLLNKMATTTTTYERDPESLMCVHLECIPKSHEDRYLCAPRGDELPCSEGRRCEGVLMAVETATDSSLGFVCKQWVSPKGETSDGLCLLCLRKRTCLIFYNCQARQEIPTTVLQPHRNVIGMSGEYHPDACIYPSSKHFEGITDPFIRHERHHYRYVSDERLEQVNVDFR
jgi:hypothetical protein